MVNLEKFMLNIGYMLKSWSPTSEKHYLFCCFIDEDSTFSLRFGRKREDMEGTKFVSNLVN